LRAQTINGRRRDPAAVFIVARPTARPFIGQWDNTDRHAVAAALSGRLGHHGYADTLFDHAAYGIEAAQPDAQSQ
jgi:hypothetical protein